MRLDYVFTSESVTEGHPDKIADQVSDAILDALLERDKNSRVAVETVLKTGFALVAGEVTSSSTPDIPAIVRQTIKDIGYTSSDMGFDGGSCAVMVAIEGQSGDIGRGVDPETNAEGELGAGDQGMMFGYACNDTEQLMPAPIAYAHQLSKALADARRNELSYLRPDGKSQVSVRYENGIPSAIDAVVVSTQHAESVSTEQLRREVEEVVIRQTLPKALITNDTKIHINPTGRFVTGGPMGDAGLTGRKIIVDTYGGMGRHGGGAFSGKDPTKVDRSAAYMGRYVAKNVVAAGLAKRVEVQVAYAIGVARPVSILVDTFGTGVVSDEAIARAIDATFGFKPQEIIETLSLLRPIYRPTAAYGHFGRSEPDFFWERTDRAEQLAKAAGLDKASTLAQV